MSHQFLFTILLLLMQGNIAAGSIFDQLQEASSGLSLPLELTVARDSLQAATVGKQPATLRFEDAAGQIHAWSIKVAVRGKFRRHRCTQVPLKFDFRKKDLRAAGLATFDQYKLVVPCTHHRAAETRLLKEYLAYQAYQLVSPASFRVQLLQLTLKDAQGQQPAITTLAFLIEDTKELADRLIAAPLKEDLGQPASAYAPATEATHALFQYLIGNTDWNTTLAMNTKTLRLANGELLPVGYDFDFSAWVDAPYALPRRELGQRHLSQRVYLGFVQPNKILLQVTSLFLERREALTALVSNSQLPAAHQRALSRTIKTFYQAIQHYRAHDMAMLYGQLRGAQAEIVPIGSRVEDFGLME